MKTILVYCWKAFSEAMAIRAMEDAGYKVIELHGKMKDYHADAEFAQVFMTQLHSDKPDIVFSYDYFPLISMICEINQVPYVSWIYDCPQYMLLSKTITNSCNHIFCFDRLYTERLKGLGAKNVYHFPLAGDTWMYERAKISRKDTDYKCEISFVGGLYNGKKNRLLHTRLSEYAEGYVEGIIGAQKEICGYNLVRDALPLQIAEEIVKKCDITLSDSYTMDVTQMAADAINLKLTALDREMDLKCLAKDFAVTLFSNSELPDILKKSEGLIGKGTVDYWNEMPLVFRNSKINLNITSRTIESGIPQRVFDILACEGFCLTNYQPEIAEFFEDGKELVMYTGMDDMMQKAQYYLEHEEERVQIAKAGYEKVKMHYDINSRIVELLNAVRT